MRPVERTPGRDLQGPRRRLHRHRRHADDRGSAAGGGLCARWSGCDSAGLARRADHRPAGGLVRHDRALLAGRRRRRRERRLLFPLRPRGADDDAPLLAECRGARAPTATRLAALGESDPGRGAGRRHRRRPALPGGRSRHRFLRGRRAAAAAQTVDRIVALFEAEGAVAKVYSIHVNGWFGAYDKLSMTRRFVAEVLGLDLDAAKERFMFCGDSPERRADVRLFSLCAAASPMCATSPAAMAAEPAYVAAARGGDGLRRDRRAHLSAKGGP